MMSQQGRVAAAAKSLSCVPLCATPWTVATRLLCPWDSPGKNTGAGYHSLLQVLTCYYQLSGMVPVGIPCLCCEVSGFWQMGDGTHPSSVHPRTFAVLHLFVPSSLPPPLLLTASDLDFLPGFAFSRMSYSWSHSICAFQTGFFDETVRISGSSVSFVPSFGQCIYQIFVYVCVHVCVYVSKELCVCVCIS